MTSPNLTPLTSPVAVVHFEEEMEQEDSDIKTSAEDKPESDHSQDHRLPSSPSPTTTSSDEDAPLLVDKHRVHYGSLKPKRKGFLKSFRRASTSSNSVPDPRCHCHVVVKKKDNKARNKLILASALVLIFMIGEIIGGWMVLGWTYGWTVCTIEPV